MTTNGTEETLSDDQQKMLFEEKLQDFYRKTSDKAFLAVPELRSVVIVFDYKGKLNDAPGVNKGMWLHAEGGAEKPADSIVGSAGATIQALAHIIDEQMNLYSKLSNELLEVSKALVAKKQEAEDLK